MTNGYQSDLLLSDRLIVTAVITLNDGGGNILRRRLMSFAPSSPDSSSSLQLIGDSHHSPRTQKRRRDLLQLQSTGPEDDYVYVPLKADLQIEPDDSAIRNALQQISQQPRTGSLPAFQYNVDIVKTMTDIYGVDETKAYNVFDFVLYGR